MIQICFIPKRPSSPTADLCRRHKEKVLITPTLTVCKNLLKYAWYAIPGKVYIIYDITYIRTYMHMHTMYIQFTLASYLTMYLIRKATQIQDSIQNFATQYTYIAIQLFLNQARAAGRRAPDFLKLILCGSSLCVPTVKRGIPDALFVYEKDFAAIIMYSKRRSGYASAYR